MRYEYTFEDGAVMVYNHPLQHWEEDRLTIRHGDIVNIRTYEV